MSHHHSVKRPPPVATASAVGGKTARACDGCLRRRARWYCAADDAFLCQPCDSSVHSANQVARRHERLRVKGCSGGGGGCSIAPAWHHGFKRKARTPRQHHHAKLVVPELETSAGDEEEEEQLLYRVPVFNPGLDIRSPARAGEPKPPPQAKTGFADSSATAGVDFISSEAEMEEFSADMESLLGRGLDGGEAFGINDLGLVDTAEGGGRPAAVKPEVGGYARDGGFDFEMEVDLSRETLELDIGCGSPAMAEEEKPETATERGKQVPSRLALQLDYDAVVAAWSALGRSPWTSGKRPLLRPEEFWLECVGMWSGGGRGRGGGEIVGGIHVADVGREARVSRYREKRRTRLFSKKIRYEVRKLNAEKRPRMKGRFVKRTTFAAANADGGGGGVTFAY
ncbi:hypothetical protein HPP92_006141 [Vanilla planifolia]|uniref:Uncharacterized protein n=1 Tax=Vanilla planifolia TaxID=51239 RepID=A0A835VCX4_VANPL|nr:hypothetical protein HPP92_006141 [Vanilla planifolia]